jgi:ankyrin repeat protein
VALCNGCDEIVKILVNAGADINAKNDNGETLFHEASQSGIHWVVESLV